MAKHHILVVDDEPTNLHIMRQVLKDDYDLSFVKTGHETVQLAEKIKPDLILLDLMLPDIDGFEVCRRLKAYAKTESIPVIFVTSQDDGADEAMAFQAGAVDYITKPVSRSVVLARVSIHLALASAALVQRGYLELIHRSTDLLVNSSTDTQCLTRLVRDCSRHLAENANMSDQVIPHFVEAIVSLFCQGKDVTLGEDELSGLELEIVTSIHEKWDGQGLPNGLQGDAIPLTARIASIIRAIHALCSLRIDNKALSDEQIVSMMRQGAGIYYDPLLIEFIEDSIKCRTQHAA